MPVQMLTPEQRDLIEENVKCVYAVVDKLYWTTPLHSRSEIEDIEQEAFLATCRDIHRWDQEKAGIVTFLHMSARYGVINVIDKQEADSRSLMKEISGDETLGRDNNCCLWDILSTEDTSMNDFEEYIEAQDYVKSFLLFLPAYERTFLALVLSWGIPLDKNDKGRMIRFVLDRLGEIFKHRPDRSQFYRLMERISRKYREFVAY